MPRLARLDMVGILQHVMVRGIEKRDIFVDDRDRVAFIDRFSRLLVSTQTECLAWSLLSNHAHLLLRPTKGKLSDMMRRLLTGYAVAFNLRHHRCGHLFQNRYKSIVCEEDSYLLELVRYIHLNPLRAGLVSSMRQLDSYRWTGHAGIMGHTLIPGQATDEVLLMFADNRNTAQQKYRDFVSEGIAMGKRDELVGGGIKRQLKLSGSSQFQAYDARILGSGEFVEQLWHKTESVHASEAVSPPSLEHIIELVATVYDIESSTLHRGGKQKVFADAKAVICFLARRRFGYTTVEVSNRLALSRSGVIVAAERGQAIYATTDALGTLFSNGASAGNTTSDNDKNR